MKNLRLLFILSLIPLVFSSSFAWALTLKQTTLAQRVGWTARICEVTITDKRVENDVESDGRPAVYYTATVHECVKGSASSPFVFKQVALKEVPQYSVNERYLLFLPAETDDGYVAPVGFGQGVLRLKQTNGRWTATALARKSFENEARLHSVNLRGATEGSPADDYASFKETLRKMGEAKP